MRDYYVKIPIDFLLDENMKPVDKLVLQYLSWRQGNNGDCWPSLRTISAEIHVGLEAIQNSIKRLIHLGKISVQSPKKQGRGYNNHYKMNVSETRTIETENNTGNRHNKKDKCIGNPHSKVSESDTEKVSETDTENKPGKTHHKNKPQTVKFKPPTFDEVQEYIRQNPELSNVDAENFWKGFNDSGWIDTHGKSVRNWKLKLRTWSNFAKQRSVKDGDSSRIGRSNIR